jgi:TRAP-type C4-dicarboxylate transport system permease small subunit
MNTIGGILLALFAGAIVWGMIRFMTPAIRHPWGIRIFWILCVVGLMSSTQVADPWNMAIMGFFAGCMIFEHICQRYLSRLLIKKKKEAAKKEEAPRKKRPSSKS